MVVTANLIELILQYEEVVEDPDFDNPSYKVGKKKFAILNLKNRRLTILLSEPDQKTYIGSDKSAIYPVFGILGKEGWTVIELGRVRRLILQEVLRLSYCNIAPKRLSKKHLLP